MSSFTLPQVSVFYGTAVILSLSKKLATRLKCQLSLADQPIASQRLANGWSGDLFSIKKKGTFALLMHDISCYPIILPIEKGMVFADFVQTFLTRLAMVYQTHGAEIEIRNTTLVAVRRVNRSLIGTMNNAIFLVTACESYGAEGDAPFSCDEHALELAGTPFNAVEGHFPDKSFADFLAKSGASV